MGNEVGSAMEYGDATIDINFGDLVEAVAGERPTLNAVLFDVLYGELLEGSELAKEIIIGSSIIQAVDELVESVMPDSSIEDILHVAQNRVISYLVSIGFESHLAQTELISKYFSGEAKNTLHNMCEAMKSEQIAFESNESYLETASLSNGIHYLASIIYREKYSKDIVMLLDENLRISLDYLKLLVDTAKRKPNVFLEQVSTVGSNSMADDNSLEGSSRKDVLFEKFNGNLSKIKNYISPDNDKIDSAFISIYYRMVCKLDPRRGHMAILREIKQSARQRGIRILPILLGLSGEK